MHDSIGELIIDAEEDTTTNRTALAVHNDLEVIATLNFERRIYSADVSIKGVLRHGQQAGSEGGRAILQLRETLDEDKSVCIIVGARAWQCPCSTEPLRGTGTRYKVKDRACYRRRLDSDIHPEGPVRSIGCAEDLTTFIPDLPVAAIAAFKQRSSEIHGEINRLPRCDRGRQWHKVLPTQYISTDQDEPIVRCPCTGAVVFQSPHLGELGAGRQDRVIGNRHIADKFDPVTAKIRGGRGRLNRCEGRRRGTCGRPRGSKCGRRCECRSEGWRARGGQCGCVGAGRRESRREG